MQNSLVRARLYKIPDITVQSIVVDQVSASLGGVVLEDEAGDRMLLIDAPKQRVAKYFDLCGVVRRIPEEVKGHARAGDYYLLRKKTGKYALVFYSDLEPSVSEALDTEML